MEIQGHTVHRAIARPSGQAPGGPEVVHQSASDAGREQKTPATAGASTATETLTGDDVKSGPQNPFSRNNAMKGDSRGPSRRTPWVVAMACLVLGGTVSAETWRGLTIAPEHRCSPYERKRDYAYPQSVEQDIVRALGAVYGPYTGTCFRSTGDTDIEHIVATSEAHDSGLCAEDSARKRRFATDLRNLTLASPRVNRHQKSGKDAGEWLPELNRCWFAGRVLEVKRAYGLTVDQREAEALERILRGCTNTAMEPKVCRTTRAPGGATGQPTGEGEDALARYDDNRNGRITCKEARRHGIAPVPRSHPAYRYMRDGDGDGVVCE